MTYTGTSDSININGAINVCITGTTINTTIEYSPDAGTTWFPLQATVGEDTVITDDASFNLVLPAGKVRFNGGTDVTVFTSSI